jgi:hypothetical protein
MSTLNPQNETDSQAEQTRGRETALVESTVTPVQAEPLGADVPVAPEIEPDRRLSWMAWAAALVLFIINRKLGLLFIIVLLVFRQYPKFNLQALMGKGKAASRKNRS